MDFISVYGRNLRQIFRPCLSLQFFFFSLMLVMNPELAQAQNFVQVEKVDFVGLKKTRISIASRELAFREGQEIAVADTSLLFQNSCRNLMNTRLFHYVTYRMVPEDSVQGAPVKIRLLFYLQERWYTTPIPVLELADRNFNEWWYDRNHDFRRINAGLTLFQKNVRGRNEDLVIGVQTGFTRRLDFSYFIPYLDRRQIFGLKLQAIWLANKEVAVRSEENRLLFVKDEDSYGRERLLTGLQLIARPDIYRYHSLEFNYHYNRISQFIRNQNPGYFLGADFQRYLEMRYTFTMDHRNYRYYATEGWLAGLRLSRIGILPGDNFSLFSFQANYSVYFPLGKRFFWATRLDAEIAEDKRLPYLGSRTLGYENRFVRGYERNVLEGNASAHIRNSLRWKFFTKVWKGGPFRADKYRYFPLDVYLSPFADAGYLRNRFVLPENRRMVNTPLLGYGIGLHAVTVYDLVFRIEYTLNQQGGSGLYFSLLADI